MEDLSLPIWFHSKYSHHELIVVLGGTCSEPEREIWTGIQSVGFLRNTVVQDRYAYQSSYMYSFAAPPIPVLNLVPRYIPTY